MTSGEQKIAKIQTHFKALSEIASTLNTASDELTKTIAVLDEALKKLNVGLTVWVTFRSRDDERVPYVFDQDQIGYDKVNGVWGIALRRIWGDESNDQYNEDGPWAFNAASRELRLHSVDKIPEVIEALAKEAFNITKRIQEKTIEVRELAGAIGSANEMKAKSLTLTERVAAGQKALTGRLSDMAGDTKEGSK